MRYKGISINNNILIQYVVNSSIISNNYIYIYL